MPARERVFYGWYVVLGAWLSMFVSSAAIASFSIFAPELEAEFGWTRTMSSWAYTLNTVSIAVFGLVAGALADRIGLRRMVIIGAIIGGAGTILLSLTSQLWHFYLLYGLLAPAGISLCFIVPTVATVRRWFMRKAAVSVAVAMTGSALGVVILIPIIESLIGSIGWSYSYVVLGVIVALVAAIGGSLLKKDPESHGMHPDGIEPTDEEMRSRIDFASRLHVWTAKEAFKTYGWWLLLFAQFFQIAVIGMIGHMVFWGEDLGVSKPEAVNILILLVLAAVLGRLFGGFFSDWYMSRFSISRKPILYIGTICVAVGCLLAMWANDRAGMIIVSLLVGFGYGIGLAVFPSYLGDLYGVVSVPKLFGIMFFCTAGIFGAMGPILYGAIHDSHGSYELAFLITAVLCFISAAALFPIRTPRKKPLT